MVRTGREIVAGYFYYFGHYYAGLCIEHFAPARHTSQLVWTKVHTTGIVNRHSAFIFWGGIARHVRTMASTLRLSTLQSTINVRSSATLRST